MATAVKRRKSAPVPVHPIGETGQSWQDTQPRNRRAKLVKLGASEAQIKALASRHYWQLSLWVKRGLKRLLVEERRLRASAGTTPLDQR